MARRRKGRTINGIILLDKATGGSSNQVLQQVRRLFGAQKAGHTGALDPLASGMLPICLGEATKFSQFLLDADKTYEVTAHLGIRTSTSDADGEVVEHADKAAVTEAELQEAIKSHLGELEQVPPMYSALKKDGKRLYELARQGIEVERQPRKVVIHELEIVRFDPQRPVLRVRCSKGTYVRRLVETLAEQMGTLGHVAILRR